MFDANMVDMSDFVTDVHAIAGEWFSWSINEDLGSSLHTGALKLYLRELPEPLLTFELYDSWVQAGTYVCKGNVSHQQISKRSVCSSPRTQDSDTRLQSLYTLVQSLPQENFNNFRYLVDSVDAISMLLGAVGTS